jgi:hypothetical protein
MTKITAEKRFNSAGRAARRVIRPVDWFFMTRVNTGEPEAA